MGKEKKSYISGKPLYEALKSYKIVDIDLIGEIIEIDYQILLLISGNFLFWHDFLRGKNIQERNTINHFLQIQKGLFSCDILSNEIETMEWF